MPIEGKKPSSYRSFLLRCWQENCPERRHNPVWRFSIIHVGNEDAPRGFFSLDDLIFYLRRELSGETPAASEEHSNVERRRT